MQINFLLTEFWGIPDPISIPQETVYNFPVSMPQGIVCLQLHKNWTGSCSILTSGWTQPETECDGPLM